MSRGDPAEAALAAASRLEQDGYRGYDPYDALESPVFRLPLLRRRPPRLVGQQLLKRLPLNVRPLLGIPKGYNPVTLALALEAYAYLTAAGAGNGEAQRERAVFCARELERLRSPGYSGAAWGYDFDWESRHMRIPAFMPTIVATGTVTSALFTAYRLLGLEHALPLCRSATRFVLDDLERTHGDDGSFCWSYSPNDRDIVLNATMKGARLCAQVFSVTREPELAAAAAATVRFVAARQRPDGSWPYSVGDSRVRADNFHTGYVLECLADYGAYTGDPSYAQAAAAGWRYYRARFFDDGRIPRYFDTSLHPIDATACAQSILTLCRFGDVETATAVAEWVVDALQRPDGAFAYRINRMHTNRIHYARWSTAWMLCALARLAHARARGPAEPRPPTVTARRSGPEHAAPITGQALR